MRNPLYTRESLKEIIRKHETEITTIVNWDNFKKNNPELNLPSAAILMRNFNGWKGVKLAIGRYPYKSNGTETTKVNTSRYYTRGQCIAVIKAFKSEIATKTTWTKFRKNNPQLQLPSADNLVFYFGDWTGVLDQVNPSDEIKRMLTKDECLELLKKHEEHLISIRHWDRYRRENLQFMLPHSKVISSLFGSWNQMKEILNLELNTGGDSKPHKFPPRKSFNLEDYPKTWRELIPFLEKYRTHLKTIIGWNDFITENPELNLPHNQKISRVFGSWRHMKYIMGLEPYMVELDAVAIGKRIKQIREQYGYSQSELKILLGLDISQFELGLLPPSAKIAELFEAAFNISINYLLYGITDTQINDNYFKCREIIQYDFSEQEKEIEIKRKLFKAKKSQNFVGVSMTNLDELIKYDGRIMLNCLDQDSAGVWVILADTIQQATGIYQLLAGDYSNYTALKTYFLDRGAWLSVALAGTLKEAMQLLGEKVRNFKNDVDWANDVYDAFELIVQSHTTDISLEQTCERIQSRSGVVQPENGIYMLLKLNDGYKRITVDTRTFQVTEEEIMYAPPAAWTTNDIESLLDEGTRFTTQQPLTGEVR